MIITKCTKEKKRAGGVSPLAIAAGRPTGGLVNFGRHNSMSRAICGGRPEKKKNHRVTESTEKNPGVARGVCSSRLGLRQQLEAGLSAFHDKFHHNTSSPGAMLSRPRRVSMRGILQAVTARGLTPPARLCHLAISCGCVFYWRLANCRSLLHVLRRVTDRLGWEEISEKRRCGIKIRGGKRYVLSLWVHHGDVRRAPRAPFAAVF